MKTLKTLLRNSQWHNKISIETQEVSLRIRSGTFLVKEKGSKILTKEISRFTQKNIFRIFVRIGIEK